MKEKPPARPPLKESSNLKKALAASLLMHAAVPTAVQTAEKFRERSQQAQQEGGRVQKQRAAQEKHERFQGERKRLLEQAQVEMKADNFDLANFILASNELDLQEEGRAFDDRQIREEYHRLSEDFFRRLGEAEDLNSLTQALAATLEDYSYTDTDGTMAELLASRTGSCEHISHLIVALLDEKGYGSWTGLRSYPPPTGEQIGHVTATLRHVDEQNVEHELDVVDGGPAFTEGTYLTPRDLVAAYRRSHFPDASRAAASSQRPSASVAPHFSYPAPEAAHARPFPHGSIPLFSRGIMHAYQDRGRRPAFEVPRNAPPQAEERIERSRTYELHEHLDESLRLALFVEDPIIIPEPNVVQGDVVDVHQFYSFGASEMDQASREIDFLRQAFEQAQGVRRAVIGGSLVRLYEIMGTQARLQGMTRLVEVTDQRRLACRGQALETLHSFSAAGGASDLTLFASPERFVPLMFLGEEGERTLFSLYQEARRATDRSQAYLANSLLGPLLLHSDTRDRALVELRRLDPRHRIGLYFELNSMSNRYWGRYESGAGTARRQVMQTIEMRGDDPISLEFQVASSAFSDDFFNRVDGGIGVPRPEEGISADQLAHPIRSLADLESYIQSRTQSYAVPQEFREELFLEGIRLTSNFAMNPTRTDWRTAVRTLGPFYREAIGWVEAHHPERTELLGDLRVLMRESPVRNP